MFNDMHFTVQYSIVAAVVMNILFGYLVAKAKSFKNVLEALALWWSVVIVLVVWLYKTYQVVYG